MGKVITEWDAREFHRRMNLISLLLLVCLILMIITFSKYMDKWGEEEIRRSITGEITQMGQVSVNVLGAGGNDTVTGESANIGEEISEEFVRKGDGKVISFDFKSINLDMLYKEKKTVKVNVKNNGNYFLSVDFVTNLGKFINIDPEVISLPPWDDEDIHVEVSADNVGTILGYIAGVGGLYKTYLPVIIDVSSERAPGDLVVKVVDEFKEVPSGSFIVVSTSLDGFNNDKLNIVYTIKDFNNNDLVTSSQFTNVKESFSFDKTIELPEGMKNGLYVVAVEIRYGGLVLSGSDTFEVRDAVSPVVESPKWYEKRYSMSVIVFRVAFVSMVILLILAFVLYNKEIKNERKYRKINY